MVAIEHHPKTTSRTTTAISAPSNHIDSANDSEHHNIILVAPIATDTTTTTTVTTTTSSETEALPALQTHSPLPTQKASASDKEKIEITEKSNEIIENLDKNEDQGVQHLDSINSNNNKNSKLITDHSDKDHNKNIENLEKKQNNNCNNNNNNGSEILNENQSENMSQTSGSETSTATTESAATATVKQQQQQQQKEQQKQPIVSKSAVSQRNVDIQITKKSSKDKDDTTKELTKKVLKLDLTGKELDDYSMKSPKSPISCRLPHQTSLTSSVDVEDRKTLREALYQGIFHRHRRTIFAVGSFLRMLRSRNSSYNTIRSSSEGEDVDEVR